MDIYQALIKDHDALKPLLAELVDAHDSDKATRDALIEKIRDELIPHARAEEAVFYGPLRTIDGMTGIVAHGYAEHLEAETMLRTLQAMEVAGADWKAVAIKLKEGIEHHIKDEETEIIPAARQVLTHEETSLMATAFEEMKPKIRDAGLMSNTLEMLANLMPARFAQPVREFLHRT